MARKNAEREEKTGKFAPKRTDKELLEGLERLDSVVNLEREYKDMRNLLVKAFRGTLTRPKLDPKTGRQMKRDNGTLVLESYQLKSHEIAALEKYVEFIGNKIAPNAKVVSDTNGGQKIVIQKPKGF